MFVIPQHIAHPLSDMLTQSIELFPHEKLNNASLVFQSDHPFVFVIFHKEKKHSPILWTGLCREVCFFLIQD